MSETRSVETTAPDIEEAIEEGLKILDVARSNVVVEILDEPSRGLLGIGARLARVRLTTAVPPRSAREEFVPSTNTVEESETDEPEEDDPTPQRGQASLRESVAEDDDTEIPDEVRLGIATLREVLQYMDIDADVTVERSMPDSDEAPEQNNPWILHIHGDDLGVLIGHRGKTLAALQYLCRLIASRDLQQRAEFIIDVENYKARRQVLLKRLAHRLAKDAVRRRRMIEMEPMPPHERRIIHMALRNHDQVYTQSIGEGERRRVTIVPKR